MPTITRTAEKALKEPSKTALKNAANLLQRAHDVIEVNGFDISEYGLPSQVVGKFRGKAPEIGAPMCYIGNLRSVAGVNPNPGDLHDGIAVAGDGPELVVALNAMDKIAKRRMTTDGKQHVRGNWGAGTDIYDDDLAYEATVPGDVASVGRFVEQFGFEIKKRAEEKFPAVEDSPWGCDEETQKKRDDYQRDYALKLLRDALTEIYR